MSLKNLGGIVVAGVLVAVLVACGLKKEGGAEKKAEGAAAFRIAMIPKGTTHSFWKSVEAGARKAAAELNVDLVWKGPLKEDDRAQQIAVVQQFVVEKVSGIVVAPLDAEALRTPVQAANDAKIPVVIFDSALNGEAGKDFVSLVATDNKKGGYIGGQHLAKLLGGKGKVVLLRYQEGSASTQMREEGFLDAMKENPGIEIISKDQYSGATTQTAQDKSLNMLDKLKEADGIFCPNQSSTFGMLLTLQKSQLAGQKKFVGFDSDDQLLKGLADGQVNGLVIQNPGSMGYLAVKTMVAQLKGEKVEQRVDTGCALVTPENVGSPEIRAMMGLK